MELIASSWGAKRVSMAKAFIGSGRVLKVGRKKFRLPGDIEKTVVATQQNEMKALRIAIIIVLAVTVFGLVLAIPLYFAGKKKRLTMALRAKTGETFTVAASRNAEWKILQKYAGIGILD